jgi:hypothetical protein
MNSHDVTARARATASHAAVAHDSNASGTALMNTRTAVFYSIAHPPARRLPHTKRGGQRGFNRRSRGDGWEPLAYGCIRPVHVRASARR